MKIIILKGGLGNQLFQISLYLYLVSFLSKEKIKILKTTRDIMDYWLLNRNTSTLETFKNKFSEVEVPIFST